MGAFPDASVRDALLAELRAPSASELTLLASYVPPPPEELRDFAARTGFTPAFILLVMFTNGRSTFSSFLQDLLTALPAGADTHRLAYAWLAQVWRELGDDNDDPQLQGVVGYVLALAEQASRGDAVSDDEWKTARSACRRLDDPEARRLAEVVAAAAWDPEKVPTAYADVMSGWLQLVEHRTDVAMGWTPEIEAQSYEHMEPMQHYATTYAGPIPDESDEAAMKAFVERYEKGVAEYSAKHLPGLPDHGRLQMLAYEECQDRARALMLAVIETARTS